MKQDVMFSILMILLSKRKTSRVDLAERFALSERTISRYLRTLEDSGVPILCESGRNGGVMIYDDFTLDTGFLTEAETLRIKDALLRTDTDYSDRINRAIIEKLENVDKSRTHMSDAFTIKQDELYIDCDYEQAAVLRPKIKLFASAIEQSRPVEIKYTDARGYETFRTIEPYTLVFKAGAWYIYALCRLRGDFRLFKLTRMRDVRITSKSFVKTESKLAEKLGLEFYNEVYVEVEFEFFPTVASGITDWLGADAVRERGTKLYAVAEVPLTESIYKKLLGFGSSIKVISPPELAERLKEEAALMLRIYD